MVGNKSKLNSDTQSSLFFKTLLSSLPLTCEILYMFFLRHQNLFELLIAYRYETFHEGLQGVGIS